MGKRLEQILSKVLRGCFIEGISGQAFAKQCNSEALWKSEFK